MALCRVSLEPDALRGARDGTHAALGDGTPTTLRAVADGDIAPYLYLRSNRCLARGVGPSLGTACHAPPRRCLRQDASARAFRPGAGGIPSSNALPGRGG